MSTVSTRGAWTPEGDLGTRRGASSLLLAVGSEDSEEVSPDTIKHWCGS